MKYINLGRRNGKTLAMVYHSYITGIPIIVTTEKEKKILLETAEHVKCNIDVFTLNDRRCK